MLIEKKVISLNIIIITLKRVCFKKFHNRKPVTGGWLVSAFDCYVRGLPFESGILPLLKQACREQWPAAMLTIKRLAGVAIEVNLREHPSCMFLPSANKAAHSGFETQRCHQKSKTGVSVALQKGLVSSKNLNVLWCFHIWLIWWSYFRS